MREKVKWRYGSVEAFDGYKTLPKDSLQICNLLKCFINKRHDLFFKGNVYKSYTRTVDGTANAHFIVPYQNSSIH